VELHTATRRPLSRRRRTAQRVAYEIDRFNRLVVRRLDARGLPVGRRMVLDGVFTTDERARLVYHVDSVVPSTVDGWVVPREVALAGRWGLAGDHALTLTLDQAHGLQETLTLRGELLTAEAHELTVAVTTISGELHRTRVLKLGGRWQADDRNRLTFVVSKEQGGEDRLTFDGAWNVGPHHELVYRYRTRDLRRGLKREQTLILRGVWELTSRHSLSYRVGTAPDSVLQFRAGLRTPSVRAQAGRLAYEVGIGLSRRRTRVRRVVTLFGTWKLDRRLGLSFEIDYGRGRRQAIWFEASVAATDRHRITLAVRSRRGESLGIELELSRRWLRDAELFARLTRRDGASGVEIGGRIPW